VKKRHHCLLFDLRDVEERAGGDRLTSLKSYLRKTIEDFLDDPSLQKVVDKINFTERETASPADMIAKMAQKFVSDCSFTTSHILDLHSTSPIETAQLLCCTRPL
jgi:hypothetical protein